MRDSSTADRSVFSIGLEVEEGLADERRVLFTGWEAAGLGSLADRSVFSTGLEVERGTAEEGWVPEDVEVESLCKRVNVDWLEGTAGEATISDTGTGDADYWAERALLVVIRESRSMNRHEEYICQIVFKSACTLSHRADPIIVKSTSIL